MLINLRIPAHNSAHAAGPYYKDTFPGAHFEQFPSEIFHFSWFSGWFPCQARLLLCQRWDAACCSRIFILIIHFFQKAIWNNFETKIAWQPYNFVVTMTALHNNIPELTPYQGRTPVRKACQHALWLWSLVQLYRKCWISINRVGGKRK